MKGKFLLPVFLPRYMPSPCAPPGWWPVRTPPPGTTWPVAASTTSAPSTAWRLGRATSGSAGNYLATQVKETLWSLPLNQTDQMVRQTPASWEGFAPKRQMVKILLTLLINGRATGSQWAEASNPAGEISDTVLQLLQRCMPVDLTHFCLVKWHNMALIISLKFVFFLQMQQIYDIYSLLLTMMMHQLRCRYSRNGLKLIWWCLQWQDVFMEDKTLKGNVYILISLLSNKVMHYKQSWVRLMYYKCNLSRTARILV